MSARIRPIRVLLVDDSALVRQTLTRLLETDPEIEVIGAVADPILAAARMRQAAPDVIVLDVAMPRMDGLTFLRTLMAQHPLPVIICSSVTQEGAAETLRALDYGAVDIIAKPAVNTRLFLEESQVAIRDAVKAAAAVNIERLRLGQPLVQPKLGVEAVLGSAVRVKPVADGPLVVIGASTGGTEAIRVVLESLPVDCPPILVVQHMPKNFTRAFADRLDQLVGVRVTEAADGDVPRPGCAYIAAGDRHLVVASANGVCRLDVVEGPLVCRHRPSVDVLFRSAADVAGSRVVAALLTGMGDDGAEGMVHLASLGAHTIAQDEATSVVWGMPAEAVSRGGAAEVLPLDAIGRAIVSRLAGLRVG